MNERGGTLPEALLDPAAYPHPAHPVELITTHVSWVFLAGERVYKVKRPVRFDFVDLSSPERRRDLCYEEVRLNQRLSPGMYLGVTPVVRRRDGNLAIGGEGEVVEHAVVMVRLPARRMLTALLETGEVDNAMLDAVAARIARFHREAATGPGIDEHGSPSAVAKNARDNLAALASAPGDGPPLVRAALLSHLGAATDETLSREHGLFGHRMAGGSIREGHGDLHAGNICFTDGGVTIYDCVEFSIALRAGDVAADLAFLAMDLDASGYRGFSSYLCRRYAKESDDGDLDRLLPFYKAYRALVRAKIAAIQVRMAAGPNEEARTMVAHYAHLAVTYALPPVLVLTCGLPGAGKSSAGRAVARPFEAAIERSDVVRKQLFGLPSTAHAPSAPGEGLYTEANSDATYARLLEATERHLEAGRSVVVDANFGTAARRAPFLAAAARRRIPLAVLHVSVPEDVSRARLERRAAEPDAASDAGVEVYESARRHFEAPDEVPPGALARIDGAGTADATTADALVALLRAPSASPRFR